MILIAEAGHIFPCGEPRQVHCILVLDELARFADVFGSFKFISSQHPYFDSSLLQRVDCLRDVILEPVFDSGRSDQDDASLKITVDFVQFGFTIQNILFGFFALVQEMLRLRPGYNSHAHQQSP